MNLSEILSSYSEGELALLVGKKAVDDYRRISGEDVEEETLLQAAITLNGFSIVSDPEKRKALIERMNENQVVSLINEFVSEFSDLVDMEVSRNRYDVLISFANKWPERFIKIFGYSENMKVSDEASQSISGISEQLCNYPTYPYQRELVGKVASMIHDTESTRCILHLPTGSGKTRTAMNIASEHLRQREDGLVLWLADTSELCTQAVNEFSSAWSSLGNRVVKIYSYYSDTEISLGGIESGFLVAGLQKLNAARGSKGYSILYETLREHVSLVIFDEAHKAIAPTYAKTVDDMMSIGNDTFFLGLTATPGRALDNVDEDKKLADYFSGRKITMKVAGYISPIQYLVEKQYLAKAEFVNVDYEGNKVLLADEFSNQKRSQEIRDALSEDDSRNKKLIEVIAKEYRDGGSIIVFACSVAHSQALATLLALNGIEAFSLDSRNDDNESRRIKIAEYSKGNVRVIVNYNILTTGFDAPITNVAIIARPTDSLVQYSQMAGRAMRGKLSGGNEDCRIYTVRDDIPAFTSVVRAFAHWDELWSEV